MGYNSGDLQAFFDLAKVVLLSLDVNGQVDFINSTGAALIGWRSKRLFGSDWFESCVPDECRQSVKQVFDELISGILTETEHCHTVLTQNGNRRIIAWNSRVRHDSQGLVTGVYSTGVDVTRSIAAESGEQATAAKYSAIVDTAADAIITSDSRGIITSFNKAAEKYFGYQREEILGKNIALLTPEPHRSQHDQYIRNYVETGIKKIIGIGREVVGRRKDGSEFPIELAVTEAKVGTDRIFAAIIRDITERKHAAAQLMSRSLELQQLQEQLLHMDRLHIVDEMASGIAHEINQPLTAIINYASSGMRLVGDGTLNSQSVLDVIGRIDQQARRAADIVRMLRNMMKKRPANYERVDLIQLIEDAIELLSLLNANTDDILITKEWPGSAVMVEADAVQVQQVIINLINNSLDALSNHPVDNKNIHLKITVQSKEKVRLSVRDNGPGVAPDDRAHLFEPFFSTKMDGLGLGLSICRSVASEHGGELHYNAQCQDGSEFFFDLPVIVVT